MGLAWASLSATCTIHMQVPDQAATHIHAAMHIQASMHIHAAMHTHACTHLVETDQSRLAGNESVVEDEQLDGLQVDDDEGAKGHGVHTLQGKGGQAQSHIVCQ